MAKDSALLSELHKIIGQRMEAGQIAQPSEIVEEILQSKPLTGPHAHFYRAFAKKQLVGCLTSAPTGQICGFEQGRLSGSSKPLWSEDEQDIWNIERRR